MLVDLIVGARPNFMKAAPVIRAAARRAGIGIRLVHTGQHYDPQMNETFFADLGLPQPDVNLEIGSATHAQQVARIMLGYEGVIAAARPDACMVVGDVNSTIAAALVAAKENIPVWHLEAGLRSGDWHMPEEINRLATDAISRLLLAPSRDAVANLRREGIAESRIAFVGNVMIDNLHHQLAAAERLGLAQALGLGTGEAPTPFALVTLHRPANVDDSAVLAGLVAMLGKLAATVPVLFPMHPRTRLRLRAAGLEAKVVFADEHAPRAATGLPTVMPPLSYNAFLHLMRRASVVLTDSGGVQEETTALGVTCLTLRESTERPITVSEGTNTVVGHDFVRALALAHDALAGHGKAGRIPDGWDGHAAERVWDAVEHAPA
jgi:UDP-N-acetylglucosamine 2-epimerase (non-hydrolysing)